MNVNGNYVNCAGCGKKTRSGAHVIIDLVGKDFGCLFYDLESDEKADFCSSCLFKLSEMLSDISKRI